MANRHGPACQSPTTQRGGQAPTKAQTVAMTRRQDHEQDQRLWDRLTACGSLAEPTLERDRLWFAVQAAICTRAPTWVTPLGSSASVPVSAEQGTDELIAAMSWLTAHEREARRLPPRQLFIALRGVATRGADGSARAAQADALHGMTGVPAGQLVHWRSIEETGAA